MKTYENFIIEAIKSNEDTFIQSAKRGSNEKIKQFIKSGKIDINMKSKSDGRTALMWASLNNFLMVVNTLLEAGADPNICDNSNRTPLMAASTNKIINSLLKYDIDVNIQSYTNGDTAIMEYLDYHVSSDNMISYLIKFLDKGLNLDIKNNRGLNFYEKIRTKIENERAYKNQLLIENYTTIVEYMDNKFPQYKDAWDLEHDMNKYNL